MIDVPVREPRSPLVAVLIKTFKNTQARIGSVILTLIILGAIGADLIAPYGAREQTEGARLLGPSLDHLLGTDEIGRDIFSRILFGLRASLLVSVVGVTIGAGIGTFVGFMAGYVVGIVETPFMRFVDILLAFPALLMGIAIVPILGPGPRIVATPSAARDFLPFGRLA